MLPWFAMWAWCSSSCWSQEAGIWDTIALVLFVAGVLLMLGAVIVEFLELEMGRDTVKLEIQDVMVEHERDSVDDEHCYPRR